MAGVDDEAAGQKRFLESLAATGNVSGAARAAGLKRSTLYRRRGTDPDFATAWADAEAEAADALLAEARRRAVEGIEIPIVRGGRVVTDDDGNPVTIRQYSDRLLEFLLRTRFPAMGDEDGPKSAQAPLSVEERIERLDQLTQRVRARAARRSPAG